MGLCVSEEFDTGELLVIFMEVLGVFTNWSEPVLVFK